MDYESIGREDLPVTSEAMRSTSMMKRMRVLLHAYPLFQLRSADMRRDEAIRHYDTLTVALKIMDIIAERMGMDVEADRAYIDFSIEPLLTAMDAYAGLIPDKERHLLIVDRVLGALRNDGESRRPFGVEYTDINEDGSVANRLLGFRLVEDAFGLGGETVLRLTNEAVNLYFNALELDIEDSQAATEAIVHSQLTRGRFDEALRSAHGALLQSRMYREKLEKLMRDTQRDIARVDWFEEAPHLIDKATEHLENRLDTERNIIISTQQRLEQLVPGTAEAAAVARIAEVMQYCVSTHTILQRELMKSRTVFLDSQARQAFVPVSLQRKADLTTEVLEPLLKMSVPQANAVMDKTVPLLLAPAGTPLVSLYYLFDGLLRPKRPARKEWVEVEAMEIDHFAKDLSYHSAEDRAIVEAFLKSIVDARKLSDLLAYFRAMRYSAEQREILVLLVLQHFDRTELEDPLIKVRRADAWLDDGEYYGEDMIVEAIGE